MVVSAPAPPRRNPPVGHRPADSPPIPSRRPLTPSETDNASALSRRHKTKPVPSRYLSSSSSSSSSSTSTSYSSNTTTSSSSHSSSRRSHSPADRPQSAGRSRPDPPRSDAARALCTTTRSLSVSFQGEPFFYHTSKARPPSPSPSLPRKPTPDRRRPPNPSDFHQRWPAARARPSGLLTKSLECSADKNEFLSAIHSIRQSSSDGAGIPGSSTPEPSGPRPASRTGRFRHSSEEPVTPVSSVRRDGASLIPRAAVSPMKGAGRPGTPSRAVGGSPARGRCGGGTGMGGFSPGNGAGNNAPSILSFAAEVRRSRRGEGRIEEAHLLRLLHNKCLQWRCVNARGDAVLMVQRMNVEVRFVLWDT